MKIPRIGLYSRFFALFGGSTFLLAVCIALGTFAMSEEFARNFVKERHQQLDEMLTIAIDTSDDVSVLKERAKENRVQLMITRGNERLITSDSFPDINTLLNLSLIHI